MVQMPPPPPRTIAGREMRVIRAVAAAIALLAALALMLCWRALAVHGAPSVRGGEAVGATFAPAGRMLVVDSLQGDGPAARADLRVGDLLLAVNGARVGTVADADQALLAPVVDIRVRRRDRELMVHLRNPGGATHG